MVLARLADFLSSNTSPASSDESATSLQGAVGSDAVSQSAFIAELRQGPMHKRHQKPEGEEGRPPYIHAAVAGGLGGLSGDMLMHSLDTVKTRQQGDPHRPPKYTSLGNSYFTILRQEGIRRGLYGGVAPAFIGSFCGTFIFFGTYEWSKRQMIDRGLPPSAAYLAAGFVADLAASPLYVPTEVVKTRLQLQGQHNNPHFNSGYNYKSTFNAAKTIARSEGISALFYGYRATLYRDLPFSALQFVFYEKEREAAKWWVGSKDIGLPLEILVGATAGGAAGVITCPLDVVKTRLQTQIHSRGRLASEHQNSAPTSSAPGQSQQIRHISTGAPSAPLRHGSVRLNTSSAMEGLRIIYKTEGLAGWFRGVGPRGVWTSVQSGTMLVLYQVLLGKLEEYPLVRD